MRRNSIDYPRRRQSRVGFLLPFVCVSVRLSAWYLINDADRITTIYFGVKRLKVKVTNQKKNIAGFWFLHCCEYWLLLIADCISAPRTVTWSLRLLLVAYAVPEPNAPATRRPLRRILSSSTLISVLPTIAPPLQCCCSCRHQTTCRSLGGLSAVIVWLATTPQRRTAGRKQLYLSVRGAYLVAADKPTDSR